MKAMQIMMFILLLFMSFYLLSATGIFFNLHTFNNPNFFTKTISYSLIAGFSTAAVTGVAVSRIFGVNPYITASHIAFISFYGGVSISLLTLLNMIMSEFGPDVAMMMGLFSIIVAAILIMVAYYALLQFSTGGGKGFE